MAQKEYRYIRNGVSAEEITDASTEVTANGGDSYTFDNSVDDPFDFVSQTTPVDGDQIIFSGDYTPYLVTEADFERNLVAV